MAAKKIRAGAAYVEISTDDRLLVRGLRRAAARVKAFGASLRNISAAIAGLGATIAAPLAGTARLFTTMGDEIGKASQRTGVAVEQLSALKYAADQSGSSLEGLESGFRKMSRVISDAADGSASAQQALSKLGLSVAQLQGLSPDEQFAKLADRLSKVSDATTKAALAQEIFGKSGTNLLPLINLGVKGIEELTAEAHRFGLVIGPEAADAATKFGDSIALIVAQFKAFSFHVGAAVAGALQPFTLTISKLLRHAIDWAKANRALIVSVTAIAAALVATGVAGLALSAIISGLGTVLGLAASAIGVAVTVLGAFLTPIGLVVAGLGLLTTWFLTSTQAGASALSWLGDRFDELSAVAREALGGIIDALAAGEFQLAAQILWKGLQLAWAQGIRPLQEAWTQFKFSFQAIAAEAFAGVATAWAKFRDFFERSFPNFTAGISKAWTIMIQGIGTGWETLMKVMSDGWIKLLGLLDKDIDVTATLAENAKRHDRRLQEIDTTAAKDIAEADRRRQRSDSERQAELAADLERIERQKNEAIDSAAGESDARIAAINAEIEALRAHLGELRVVSRDKRAALPDRKKDDDDDELKKIGEGIKASLLGAQGIFNIRALQTLQSMGGGAAERTARATAETARNTRKIADQRIAFV